MQELKQKNSDEDQQLIATIQYVQNEIRYLSTPSVFYGFAPHDPIQTFRNRYGDCKDKSLLLVTLLRALGFDAHVALVHSELGESYGSTLPSPYAFDHAIVKINYKNQTYWIDATNTGQHGNLQHFHQPNFGYALVLTPNTKQLEKMEQVTAGNRVIREDQYDLRDGPYGDTFVTTKVSYSGILADSARETYEEIKMANRINEGIDGLFRDCNDINQRINVPKFFDDKQNNIFTIQVTYKIENAWIKIDDGQYNVFPTYTYELDKYLRLPKNRHVRTMPYVLYHAVEKEHIIKLKYSEYRVEPL